MNYSARYAIQYFLGTFVVMYSLTVQSVLLLSNDTSIPVIHVGVLLELSQSHFSVYSGFYVKMWENAFAEIQARNDLLPGYRIQMDVRNTMVTVV